MRLYHITERENLPSILQEGLLPKYDKYLGAVTLGSATVVNLGRKSTLGEVGMLISDYWNDPVVLEVNVPRKYLLSLEHDEDDQIRWFASRKRIPPKYIKILGTPSSLLGHNRWVD